MITKVFAGNDEDKNIPDLFLCPVMPLHLPI